MSGNVIVISERFEMKRVCLGLRKMRYELTSSEGNRNRVKLRFVKIPAISKDKLREQITSMAIFFGNTENSENICAKLKFEEQNE